MNESSASVPLKLCKCECGHSVGNKYAIYLPGHTPRTPIGRYTVEDRGYETPCWISDRTKQAGGHAQMRLGRKTYWVHRIAYERECGPIPKGMHVHHRCEQPACQRTSHMTLRTLKDHGIEHGHLSDVTRAAIVEAGKDRTRRYKEIATEFGITQHSVSRIMTQHGFRRNKSPKTR